MNKSQSSFVCELMGAQIAKPPGLRGEFGILAAFTAKKAQSKKQAQREA
jgi:hypothetical protein